MSGDFFAIPHLGRKGSAWARWFVSHLARSRGGSFTPPVNSVLLGNTDFSLSKDNGQKLLHPEGVGRECLGVLLVPYFSLMRL